MDFASGVFALGGVALAAVLAETRAWRDGRTRRTEDLYASRKVAYATGLRQVEVVASCVARLVSASQEERPAARQAIWDALVSAYETVNEIRLIAGSAEVADRMLMTLRVYRDVVERDGTELPKPDELRTAMVRAFRNDLGMKQ